MRLVLRPLLRVSWIRAIVPSVSAGLSCAAGHVAPGQFALASLPLPRPNRLSLPDLRRDARFHSAGARSFVAGIPLESACPERPHWHRVLRSVCRCGIGLPNLAMARSFLSRRENGGALDDCCACGRQLDLSAVAREELRLSKERRPPGRRLVNRRPEAAAPCFGRFSVSDFSVI